MSDGAASDGTAVQASGPVQVELLVEFWTDPLCCWSWAMQPHWLRLVAEHEAQITWRSRMGCMVRDWANYEDPVLCVRRPAQMGPVCMQVRHLTGAAINDRVWVTDPPESSLPACAAVKAAQLQGVAPGEAFLSCLRGLLMQEGRNTARQEVILEAAERTAEQLPDFSLDQFRIDLDSDRATAALREDLMHARYLEIGRFPTLVVRSAGSPARALVGYRPYEALAKAFKQVLGPQPASAHADADPTSRQ